MPDLDTADPDPGDLSGGGGEGGTEVTSGGHHQYIVQVGSSRIVHRGGQDVNTTGGEGWGFTELRGEAGSEDARSGDPLQYWLIDPSPVPCTLYRRREPSVPMARRSALPSPLGSESCGTVSFYA